jgi:DNA polymerase-3 subunit delta
MTALKAADVDRFIARPDPARPIVLVFGPDAGLVRERVEALVRASVDDPQDPFALARLESENLSENPLRLVEEAHTVPLFGGRRAVWVRAGGRINIAPAVEALIAAPPSDCRVVIEAGELRRNAPLRVVCERAKNAAALPCYADSEKSLVTIVDDELRTANLAIAPDARAALLALIGGDRLASRSELRKLILYAHGKARIELDDIAAVVADASALGVDALIDAAFAGKPTEVETQFTRAHAAGSTVGAILFAALRQVAALHKMRLAIESGGGVEQVVERSVPPAQFKRRPQITVALKMWTRMRLERVMADLAAAALDTRRQSAIAETIAQRALLSIAVNARRRG